MNPKKLAPFIVVLAALIVVAILTKPPGPKDLSVEAGFVPLVPDNFLVSDIEKMEFFVGDTEATTEPIETVTLVKEDDTWHAPDKWNAPCDKEKVVAFLEKIKGLEGEFRSSAESVLDDYGLSNGEALNLVFYTSDAPDAQPLAHLLAGKKENWRNSFVRKAGGEKVYTVDVNLRSEIGLWGDDLAQAPNADTWLDKTIVDLDKDSITRVALTWPDKHIVLAKREKKVKPAGEEAEANEAKKAESSDTDETQIEKAGEEIAAEGVTSVISTDPESAEPEKKEYEWVVVEGGLESELKQQGIDTLLQALDSWTASDIVDPAKKGEWGLDTPGFVCEAEMSDGETVKILASLPNPGLSGYAFVESSPQTVYSVSNWNYKKLFPTGETLYDLLKFDMQADDVVSVELRYPERTIKAERADAESDWTIRQQDEGTTLKQDKVDNIVAALVNLDTIDYADADKETVTGLDSPTLNIVFSLKDGAAHTVVLGNDALVDKGRYCRIDDGVRALVIRAATIDRVAPEPGDLFEPVDEAEPVPAANPDKDANEEISN